MCEGPNELKIMRLLLENDALIFREDDLLGLTAYHARQIRSSTQVRTALNLYPGKDVLILRIGDKQTDKLTIPVDYKEKITGIEKYCTMPELEMLLIISEGLVKEFEKVKSKTSPKSFAKANIVYKRKRYDNSTQFFADYYGGDCGKRFAAIWEYKQINGAHRKYELYLADLLKQR